MCAKMTLITFLSESEIMAKQRSKGRSSQLHKGHRSRMKEKYRVAGADGFHPHELLEMLLYFGIPYKDTNEMAHELINKFGSFENVFEADIESLKTVKNMTDNASLLIRLVGDLRIKNGIASPAPKNQAVTVRNLKGCLPRLYDGVNVEIVKAFLVDKNGVITSTVKLSEGNPNTGEVDIFKIVKPAATQNISRVIIAHNHPDNSPLSTNDIVSTKKLSYHLKSVGIELLESYVLTNGKVLGILEMIRGATPKKTQKPKEE